MKPEQLEQRTFNISRSSLVGERAFNPLYELESKSALRREWPVTRSINLPSQSVLLPYSHRVPGSKRRGL